jgi:16S rRNA processing protein RimM
LESLEYQPQGFLVKLADVDTIEAAETLRGKRIYFPEVPPRYPAKGFYLEQIIGFEFLEQASKQTGQIRDIYETGAHFNLVLETSTGTSFDVPMVSQFVKDIDLTQKSVVLDLAKLER